MGAKIRSFVIRFSRVLICAAILAGGLVLKSSLASLKEAPATVVESVVPLDVEAVQVYPENVPVVITGSCSSIHTTSGALPRRMASLRSRCAWWALRYPTRPSHCTAGVLT